jgi:hypothetical protein
MGPFARAWSLVNRYHVNAATELVSCRVHHTPSYGLLPGRQLALSHLFMYWRGGVEEDLAAHQVFCKVFAEYDEHPVRRMTRAKQRGEERRSGARSEGAG